MLLQKVIRAETKMVEAKTGRIHAIVSNEDMDRDGDVIRVAGWILDSFKQHPVLLSSHDYISLQDQRPKVKFGGLFIPC